MTLDAPSSSISRRRVIQGSAVAGSLLTVSTLSIPPARAESTAALSGNITDLPEPLHPVQPTSTAVRADPDGRPLGYYVGESNAITNAEFTVMDLRTEETVLQVRVPHGISSQRTLALSPTDGTVYFATSEVSHVHRYVPGADNIE